MSPLSTATVRAVSPAGKRAVLYLRQSKDRADSESIENQEYLGREYCKQHGYEVVAVHVDRISGRKWDSRPGVTATMSLIEARAADVIVIWKWSRLSRSRLHWAVAADRVLTAGGRIEAVTEPMDTTTAAGRFARGVMTEYAAFQSEQIGEVWRETLDRRVREGKPATGRSRFGYIRDADADTYCLDPEVAPVVAELYRRAAYGEGMATMTRWLNNTGHRTRDGKLWQTANLTRYLDRGFPAGKLWVKGTLLPGAHEPIIPLDLWEAYLARRTDALQRPRGTVRMVSGLLRCTGCGGTMTVVRSTGGHASYACARRMRGDDSCPARASIESRHVEQLLTEWVIALPEKIELMQAAREAAAKRRTTNIEDRDALSRMIARTERRLANLTVKLLDDEVTQDAYTATTTLLNAELVSLRDRYMRAAPAAHDSMLDGIPALAEGWPGLSADAQNRTARRLVARIEVRRAVQPMLEDWRTRVKIVPLWETDD